MNLITTTTITVLLLLGNLLKAQPVLTKHEKFSFGQQANYFIMDTATMKPGQGGANITWDFTGVASTGLTYSRDYLDPVATEKGDQFMTATLAEKGNDGTTYYWREKNDTAYMEGLWLNFANILIKYTKPQVHVIRPLQYGKSYSSTGLYTYKYQSYNYRAGGTNTITVDGYGTLRLQSGIYHNVLRVKEESTFYDTLVGVGDVSTTHAVSYKWYNPYNPSPIVEMDSSVTVSSFHNSSYNTAYILKNPSTGIRDITNGQNCTMWANGNTVYISGLEDAQNKLVTIFDNTGKQIGQAPLQGNATEAQATFETPLAAGIYYITAGTTTNQKTIKLAIY